MQRRAAVDAAHADAPHSLRTLPFHNTDRVVDKALGLVRLLRQPEIA